jgi:hypothetical protein
MFRLSVPWPVKAIRRRPEVWFHPAEEPTMEERRKAQRRRQLVDRRTPEERRVGLERLLDPKGRSAEDIRRDAADWSDELDRRYDADQRSGSDQRSGADRRERPDRRKT